MFSKFLILMLFLTNINSVRANNTNISFKSFTETLTNASSKTFNKIDTDYEADYKNNNKQIIKNKNTRIILNSFFSNLKLVGQVKYTFLFWDIYDAKLITETGDFEEDKFALILKYNKEISKKEVVEETIIQLKKQKEYNDKELVILKVMLNKTFREIKKNDIFIGIKKNNMAYLYFEDEKVLETKDLNFINPFFDIWLREDSQNPAFTKKLLGQK